MNWNYQRAGAVDQAELDANNRGKMLPGMPRFFPDANPLDLLPNAMFNGPSNLAGPGGVGNFQYERRYPFYGYLTNWNASGNLTRVKGAHNIKAGVFFEHTTRPARQRSFFNGIFNFSVDGKEIAGVLLAAGAHPTIFSAAMLGQLDAVKAFVAATPGIQKTRGPHGITLLDHARNGKSVDVVKYLESLGDADPQYPNEALVDADALIGAYAFGPGQAERLVVSRNSRGALVIKREGEFDRNLFHHGGRVFNPSGAEAVRIRFEPTTGPVAALVVSDGPLTVHAARVVTGP